MTNVPLLYCVNCLEIVGGGRNSGRNVHVQVDFSLFLQQNFKRKLLRISQSVLLNVGKLC